MNRVDWIESTLRQALNPSYLDVRDDSAQHVGHAGAASGGGHFRVRIVADAFAGMDLLSRHRAVYAALGDAMRSEIHALALETFTPAEWKDASSGR